MALRVLGVLPEKAEVADMQSEVRFFTMFTGWIIAFYGVRQRSWPGTIIAMLGLGLAEAAIAIGEGELR